MSRTAPQLAVEMLPIETVIPYEKNPRHNETAIPKVARSIEQFGWQQPIVVDRHMVVVAGHTRLMAGRLLGHRTVPVVVAKNLTAKQVKAYRLADNRTGEEAEWDTERLATEIGVLRDAGFDLALTAFDAGELSKLALFGSDEAEEPEGRRISDDLKYQIVVDCADEAEQVAILKMLRDAGKKCRPIML
jgi:ParB-like chromosome segregation protein Spo0J